MRAEEVICRFSQEDKIALQQKWDALKQAALVLKASGSLPRAQQDEAYRAYQLAEQEYARAIAK